MLQKRGEGGRWFSLFVAGVLQKRGALQIVLAAKLAAFCKSVKRGQIGLYERDDRRYGGEEWRAGEGVVGNGGKRGCVRRTGGKRVGLRDWKGGNGGKWG